MSIRNKRLDVICRIIEKENVGNQEELLNYLTEKGFSTTQATLSRDLKHLKVVKIPDGEDKYVYRLPEQINNAGTYTDNFTHPDIEFSGNLAVVKTRPGYAMGIASDIDTHAPEEILGTIAGDDTILIIPREGYTREQVAKALEKFIK
ncbi:MAG: arginine repressor [Tannerellaceae bacterium]|nr:arginine repressor [Tannerellaceae bacterium]